MNAEKVAVRPENPTPSAGWLESEDLEEPDDDHHRNRRCRLARRHRPGGRCLTIPRW